MNVEGYDLITIRFIFEKRLKIDRNEPNEVVVLNIYDYSVLRVSIQVIIVSFCEGR